MTTIYVNIAEAKARLSHYIDLALKGTHVVLSKHNKPLIEMNPMPKPKKKSRRKLGLAKGKYQVPDEVFAPLEGEDLELFYKPLDL